MIKDLKTLFLTLDKYNFNRYCGPQRYTDPTTHITIATYHEIYYKATRVFEIIIDGTYCIKCGSHVYSINNLNDIIRSLESILNYLPKRPNVEPNLNNVIMDLYIS